MYHTPPTPNKATRHQAKHGSKSVKQTELRLTPRQTVDRRGPANDNFDWIYGAGTLDEAFNKAIAEQSKIEPNPPY